MSLLAVLMVALAGASPAHAGSTCDRYASPSGSDRARGTHDQPFRTAQRLADALAPGRTGCLFAGTYDQEVDGPFVLNIRHGGRRRAPLTIRSVPGQRASLRGVVYVWKQSRHVTISDLDIDARRPRPDHSTGLQLNSRHTVLERNTITTRGTTICSVLGQPGWGKAVGTVIRQNTFHDCGGTRNQLEHSLYLQWTSGVRITDNLFLRSGTYAVHLYPNARRTLVKHNIMIDNGGGVIFAGEGDRASSGNVVKENIIAGTYRKPAIHSWWGGRVGRRNVARDNCLFDNTADEVVRKDGGFRAVGNRIAPPGFRDPAHGDFRLAADSQCLALVRRDTFSELARADVLGPDSLRRAFLR